MMKFFLGFCTWIGVAVVAVVMLILVLRTWNTIFRRCQDCKRTFWWHQLERETFYSNGDPYDEYEDAEEIVWTDKYHAHKQRSLYAEWETTRRLCTSCMEQRVAPVREAHLLAETKRQIFGAT